jgi:AcrR family transcriptional regulator
MTPRVKSPAPGASDGRSTRWSEHRESRRADLVAAAVTAIDVHGPSASIAEIAASAGVSKPVVYEHFGGKEGLYAVVVDREIESLLASVQGALISGGTSREIIERAALALLDYVENSTDGFRILVRDSPAGQATGSFASLMSDIASQVEHILAAEFKSHKLDPKAAPMYAQMLVGMIALTGQWWLNSRKFKKHEVAAHVVNLAWNGLTGLESKPTLTTGKP